MQPIVIRASLRSGDPARLMWCVTFGLGCATLSAPSLVGSPSSGAAVGVWCLVFGVSACVRRLAGSFSGGGSRLVPQRLICASYGLIAWGQLSFAVLRPALMRLDAETWGALGGGVAAYAAVALVELRAIYRTAHDARFDAP